MLQELTTAINSYVAKWQAFAQERHNQVFFETLPPTAVGWKVFDHLDFEATCKQLMELSEQAHYGWVNERWLTTFYLKDDVLPQGIRIVKIMERRPGSTDAVGLDHVDFYVPKGHDAKEMVAKESEVRWTEETNGTHCTWISVWFDGTEAKLRTDTVLQVCADEMLEYQQHVLDTH